MNKEIKYKYLDNTPHLQSHHAYYLNNYFSEKETFFNQKESAFNYVKNIISDSQKNSVKEIEKIFCENDFKVKILEYVSLYGIFTDLFFKEYVFENIKEKYYKLNLNERLKLIDTLKKDFNFGRSEKVDDWIIINFIIDSLYSQYIYIDFFKNGGIENIIKDWFILNSKKRTCSLCGNDYCVSELESTKYFGSNAVDDCCLNCKIIESPVKRDIPQHLKEFIDLCGFIPSSNLGPFDYKFSKRIVNDWKTVMIPYAKMGGIEHVKKKYGTWFIALLESGVLPNGTLLTGRGIKCRALDGHECNSLDEQVIDNWLYSHKINHCKEPFYPFHSELNPKKLKRADWKIGDLYIEYFGLAGDPKYDKKTLDKYKIASDLGIKMIPIIPTDLNRLDEIFSEFI